MGQLMSTYFWKAIITLYALMDFPSALIIKHGMVNCIYQGCQRLYFTNKIAYLSLRMVLLLANGVDPDEMSLYDAGFHLGLQCLPEYTFGSHW